MVRDLIIREPIGEAPLGNPLLESLGDDDPIVGAAGIWADCSIRLIRNYPLKRGSPDPHLR